MKFLIIFGAIAATVSSVPDIDLPVFKAEFASSRIIDGHEAKKGEAPYIVSLKFDSHFCAGSIIDKHWVVTAGHCLTLPFFKVIAGLHSRNKDEDKAQVRTVKSNKYYIVHEGYGGNVGPQDIGLIYIAEPFKFNKKVNKINLPSGFCRHVGKGNLYGWGRDNSGSLPDALQVLNTSIIAYSNCKKELPDDAPLARSNICSFNKGEYASACNGDSGGPLVKSTRCGFELAGIVSWGYTPCATTQYPSVYTHTSDYVRWIHKKIESFKVPT